MVPMLILAAALLLASPPQERSLFDQVVARPDPKNGYEDYLRAADLINEPGYSATWQQDDGKTYLEVRKAAVERYGKALDFVRAGNKKQAWNPALSAPSSSKRPQLQAFLALPKLCCAEAYVNFAEGRPSRGVQSLLDGIAFSRQIRSGTTMDYLVGRIGADTVYTQFADALPSLSEPDCRTIEAYVDAQLAAPDPFQQILNNWLDAKMGQLAAIFDLKPGEPVGDAKLEPAVAVIAKLSPAERRDVVNQIRDRVKARFAEYAQKLQNAEGQLMSTASGQEPETVSTASDLADFLSVWLSPNVPVETILVDRTQLRLLGLHARVIDYRWRNGRLPVSLKDAAPGDLANDPASGGAFVYEPHGDGTYRLYSKGFGVGGPVELGHQEARVRIGGTGVPPPDAPVIH